MTILREHVDEEEEAPCCGASRGGHWQRSDRELWRRKRGRPDAINGVAGPLPSGWFSGQTAGDSELASLERANAWLNSPPLTAADLRGKVVLIDFWTYTCINWRRTLPYILAWNDKYRSQGLVVIGVHAPEFWFEKDPANVRQAVEDMHIDYPVAVDSDHVIWRAFDNQY
jgi:thiol-disulfide isomerase/thioredoxin